MLSVCAECAVCCLVGSEVLRVLCAGRLLYVAVEKRRAVLVSTFTGVSNCAGATIAKLSGL